MVGGEAAPLHGGGRGGGRSSGEAFVKANAEGRAAFVGYLPAGFPSYDGAIEALRALVDGGVDLVELGLPYSDPVIDGVTIQAATERALRGGTRIADVFRTAEVIAAMDVPVVVMTYWNPVLAYGIERFATELASAGASGLITPDLIPDEAGDWLDIADAHDLDRVFLVAPSSTPARIASTVAACRGWVYAASTMGVTGARDQTSSAAPDLVKRVRAATQIPVGVGLGVSNREQAAEVASYADGVIVGSALVRCLLDAPDAKSGAAAVGALAVELAAGVRAGR
ncbi:MAG TPA: tryptophan synthase subunit alpha [Mycobacteriales bacterium]|nr:tryptophan synthase subunit alpha [Mycobacteriales bacterium]